MLLGAPSQAASTNAPPLPAKSDFERYRLIADRNIFNAGRSGRTGLAANKETKRPPRVDTVALVGIMSYEKGTFAFFEGSSSDFRKVLKPGGTIAGYTLREITPGAVQLQSGEKTLQLKVNSQLRREDDGEWEITARTDSGSESGSGSGSGSEFSGSGSRRDRDRDRDASSGDRRGSRSSDSSGSSSSSSGGSGSDPSEILKRLMQQREKELK